MRRIGIVVTLLLLFSLIAGSSVPQQPIAGTQFVGISPGEFMMGCSPDDMQCEPDEKPAHRVQITKAFEISKYEVTQAEWVAVMGMNFSEFKGLNRPVENVGWYDAQEFFRKLNAAGDGYRYRLPTEAEWEYAARAGTTGAYAGPPEEMGWFFENSKMQTHSVGEKRPNAWGLYDMGGNVWEWTEDWYDEKYYQSSSSIDPTGPPKGRFHSLRGGSWVVGVESGRLSERDYFEDSADFHIGFRSVRESTRLIVQTGQPNAN